MECSSSIGLIVTVYLSLVTAYDGATCCLLAKKEHAFVGLVPDPDEQMCGQSYKDGLAPAAVLEVPFRFCSDRCGGMDLHQFKETGSWTAPLVQFMLPSVIFSMTIPRRKKIEYDNLFDFSWAPGAVRLTISMIMFLVILIPVFIDTLIWISTIIVAAGNMVVSGLYEAHIDYRIIQYVRSLDDRRGQQDVELDIEETLKRKRELLITIASGNLQLDKGRPQVRISEAIIIPSSAGNDGLEKSSSRLLNLLGAQSSFGSAVGSPVLFYLGAFGYTILELYNDPSSQPAAISLGFGIEWMIIVHVAIMSGCLLASNNPSTSSGIVGSTHASLQSHTASRHFSRADTIRPIEGHTQSTWNWKRIKRILGWSDAYDTEFQPVSLWARGTNKSLWLKESIAYRDDENFRNSMRISSWGWFWKVWVPCWMLIVIPPAAGGVVAYFTPPRGIACRSLSFIIYAACQIVLVTFSTIHTAVQAADSPLPALKWAFTGSCYLCISSLFWALSLFSAVGGTLMQIVGVYDNCICYAGAKNWWRLWDINPTVNLASDTELARTASIYWRWMGLTAAIFMALNCYLGWWYQRLVRHRFQLAVEAMSHSITTTNINTNTNIHQTSPPHLPPTANATSDNRSSTSTFTASYINTNNHNHRPRNSDISASAPLLAELSISNDPLFNDDDFNHRLDIEDRNAFEMQLRERDQRRDDWYRGITIGQDRGDRREAEESDIGVLSDTIAVGIERNERRHGYDDHGGNGGNAMMASGRRMEMGNRNVVGAGNDAGGGGGGGGSGGVTRRSTGHGNL